MTPLSRAHETCQHVAYSLTCEEYETLLDLSRNRCQICGKSAEQNGLRQKLHIDHDPRYGFMAVRGLLCAACNSLMSFVDRGLKEDARAVEYCHSAWFLRRPSKST